MALVRLLPPAATFATGTLTLTGLPNDTETVTIGGKVYTWQTVLTNVDGNVLIGASAAACVTNLVAAIMLGSGSGTLYAAATTLNSSVSAADGAGDTVVLTAKAEGPAGALVTTTEASTNQSFGAATLVSAGSATVAAPTVTDATAGVAIGVTCDQGTFLIRSVLGSGVMTATPILWGYYPEDGYWYVLGSVNSGNAIAETSSDKINYAELVVGLRGCTRLYCQLSSAGTAQEYAVYFRPHTADGAAH